MELEKYNYEALLRKLRTKYGTNTPSTAFNIDTDSKPDSE